MTPTVKRELILLSGLMFFNVGIFTLNNYIANKYLVDDREYLVFVIYPLMFLIGIVILWLLWTKDDGDNENEVEEQILA